MPAHSETQFFPYSTTQLYALVADVEKYPEFLPWCRASRILERQPGYFIAELVIAFKHIREKYTSRVITTPPAANNGTAQIDVELVSGPFNSLSNQWRFEPASGGTQVYFKLEFHFKTRLLDSLIGGLFSRATEKMVHAFSERAHALYGGGTV